MIKAISTALSEIKKHITNMPTFAPRIAPKRATRYANFDATEEQIKKGLLSSSFVFLIGPFGSGKTTIIEDYLEKNPSNRYFYRSFIKITSLDFGFIHLINYLSHAVIVSFFFAIAIFLMLQFPPLAPLPLLFIIGYFFIKNPGNLIYIISEVGDNLFRRKEKIVIIEDLDRSPLSSSERWAFLANLWQHKRKYIISVGYPADKKKAKFEAIEFAMKLGGSVIEVLVDPPLNYEIIKQANPNTAFAKAGDWLCLFTPRESLMIEEQALLCRAYDKSQAKYVHIWLGFLFEKLDLSNKEILFDEKTMHIKALSISSDQEYHIDSFIQSLSPQSAVTYTAAT